MRKAYMVLGCIACILLVIDIGLTVFLNHTAESSAGKIVDVIEERTGEEIEWN